MISFILALLSLFALLMVLRAARGRTTAVNSLDDLVGRTKPVDIEALRNLIAPHEEEFLRANLPAREFRAVQRERSHAAADYVRDTAHNAAILLRLGEAATQSADPKIVAAGQQLIDNALQLRLYALLSIAKLYVVGIALPGVRLPVGKLVDSYQHLSGVAGQLASLQHPARAAPLSAIL